MTDANATAWADLPGEKISELVSSSNEMGWQAALDGVSVDAPFFVKRMRNLGLVNWHLLLGRPRSDRVLDVGSGFGSAALGLARYYAEAVGLEFLRDRLTYSTLRAQQDGLRHCRFVAGDGHNLPFADSVFGLTILNGVLEWAAYHHRSVSVASAQQAMLCEIRRVLSPNGQIAVAIENRFAAESLTGMDDTHTGLKAVTFLPRRMSNLWSRFRKGEDYRTWLYSRNGYVRLLRESGFEHIRVFDLAASYNDYDFIIDTEDALSYDLLYRRGLVRGFYQRADRLRGIVVRIRGRWLAKLSYAYLVVAGTGAPSLLDRGHPVWLRAAEWGIGAGSARFAVNGREVASLVLVAHNGRRPTGMLEIDLVEVGQAETRDEAPAHGLRSLGSTRSRLAGSTSVGGLRVRGFVLEETKRAAP